MSTKSVMQSKFVPAIIDANTEMTYLNPRKEEVILHSHYSPMTIGIPVGTGIIPVNGSNLSSTVHLLCDQESFAIQENSPKLLLDTFLEVLLPAGTMVSPKYIGLPMCLDIPITVRIPANTAFTFDKGILIQSLDFQYKYRLEESAKYALVLNQISKSEKVCEKSCEKKSVENLDKTVINNYRLEALKWARQNGCKWTVRTCENAVLVGDFELLKWAKENGCSWDADTCANAAKIGRLDILIWARENGCPWKPDTCANAAKIGRLDILKWAREHGCKFDWKTCANAAEEGHFDILKWAKENGCEWNPDACANAAKIGRLDILKWLRKNGCSWDYRTCAFAARGGHLDVLKWAKKHGCPCNSAVSSNAAEGGHFGILKWLKEHGCELDGGICGCIAGANHFDIPK